MKIGDVVAKTQGWGSECEKPFIGLVITVGDEKITVLTEDGYETWVKKFSTVKNKKRNANEKVIQNDCL